MMTGGLVRHRAGIQVRGDAWLCHTLCISPWASHFASSCLVSPSKLGALLLSNSYTLPALLTQSIN